MEETRQIEVSEIVESASLLQDGLVPVPSLAGGEVVGNLLYQDEDAQLLSLTPWELACRRAIGQIVDFIIAYGGLFLYYVKSGLISYRGSGDLIHPLAFILNLFDGWQLAWLFLLVPVPYLYLCWYFKDFRRYYTPGEMLVGVGRVPPVLGNARYHRHLLFAFRQFGQVILSIVCGFIAMIPDCWVLGLILLVGCLLTVNWQDDVFEFGMYLLILGFFWRFVFEGIVFWLVHLNWDSADAFRSVLVPFVYSIVPLTIAFWALCRENFPAQGSKLQSRSDVQYGMLSVALRKLGRSR